MISQLDPPQTYRQWLDLMNHLQEHPLDTGALEVLARGSYLGNPAPAFLQRLSETVSLVLTRHTRRFLRQVDEALADGEPDMIPVLASRLKKSIQKCLFYRSLDFLDTEYVRSLDRGYREQLENFWNDLLRELTRSARETGSYELEDLVRELKRITIVN